MPVMQTSQGPVYIDDRALGLGGESNFAASSYARASMGLPQPWSAVQTGAAPFGDNPMANSLYNILIPMITGAATGNFPGFMPMLAGQMQSPSAGYISSAYSTPALQHAQSVSAQMFGQRIGNAIGGIAGGPLSGVLNPVLSMLGTNAADLQSSFMGAGGSTPGAMLAQMAARNGLSGLSMGMSSDFEAAIAAGATHVRVGSAIFGARSYG